MHFGARESTRGPQNDFQGHKNILLIRLDQKQDQYYWLERSDQLLYSGQILVLYSRSLYCSSGIDKCAQI
jgi:hypothetical protein